MSALTTRLRRRRVWVAAAIGGLVVIAGLLRGRSPAEPVYQGRTLRQWMRGHPRDYTPAVQAIGTNALPFLLAELTVTDPGLEQWGHELFRRFLDSNPPWETARMRQFHAYQALYILGTNAVPAMIEAVLRPPQDPGDAERSWGVASALAGFGSPVEARRAVSAALESDDIQLRLAACRAYSAGLRAESEASRRLIGLTAVDDPVQRAAATRALLFWQTNESEVLPALIARLDDDAAAVRRRAIDALGGRKSNAVAALPALKVAYTNETAKSRGTDNVDPLFHGQALSVNELRWAIRWAIGEIDRSAQPAWNP